jgi:hypothetical protein
MGTQLKIATITCAILAIATSIAVVIGFILTTP